jgi:molybdenum cofactor cytidylyltransferase
LVTATTHLALEQLQLADQHYFVEGPDDLSSLEDDLPLGVILITGVPDGTNRTLGVSAETLEQIHALAESHNLPLLIEADGSRMHPIKAPADHEPPIPEFVDRVVVVAGLSGLSQPLNAEWVHRPEIFADLVGISIGMRITPEILARVLLNPAGGQKNIPASARRIALLNQADTPELQTSARQLSQYLLPTFNRVIIASLNQPSTVNHQPATIHAVHQPVAGVVLAAGEARRMGQPKLLLEWQGHSLIWHVAQNALTAGLFPVVVVAGEHVVEIRSVLEDLDVTVIQNSEWHEGQSNSMRAGLETVSTQRDAVIFLLGDQPQVSVPLIRKLVEAHAQSGDPIVGPLVDGQRGNPVLFDRITFSELMQLRGDVGGRQIFSKFKVRWVPWHDASPLLDVDSPNDYTRLLEGE